MKPQEIQVLEADELDSKLKDSRRELYELRFKLAVGQLDDHKQIRKVRQDIARLLTFKRQRELGILHAAAGDEVKAPTAATAARAEETEEARAEEPAAEPEPDDEEQE